MFIFLLDVAHLIHLGRFTPLMRWQLNALTAMRFIGRQNPFLALLLLITNLTCVVIKEKYPFLLLISHLMSFLNISLINSQLENNFAIKYAHITMRWQWLQLVENWITLSIKRVVGLIHLFSKNSWIIYLVLYILHRVFLLHMLSSTFTIQMLPSNIA